MSVVGVRAHGLVLAALLLAGCSAAPADPDRPAPEGTSTPAASDGTAAKDGPAPRYVALGDSFTAAPGVGESSGPSGCLQTDGNYPHLLAERLDLDLVDVSCAGATSRDLRASQQPTADGVPPQLRAVTPGTALVTLSIGANDAGLFADLVLQCARLGEATTGPCSQSPRFADDRLDRELDDLARQTARSVAAIRKRAPDARVIVVGYPQVVPAAGPCDLVPIADVDLPFAHDVNRRLAAAVRRGVRTAGVAYVDMWALSRGHDVCSADPWVAGLQPVGPGAPLHPYAAHQAAVADALEPLAR